MLSKTETLFYEIMNYPIPKNWEYFSTEKKNLEQLNTNDFSREEETPLLETYRKHITKHEKIFKSIPRIKKIYLCNSITFNSLNPESDIDLFIIAKKGALRRARFGSALIFFLMGLKRNRTKTNKKYCLSFYVTEDAQNLYSISLPNTDIYLAYRLTHLVPIYQEEHQEEMIYKNNPRVFSLLPNISKTRNLIHLGLPIFEGKSKQKVILEKITSGLIGKFVEHLIKTIWIPILIYKTKRLKGIGLNVIFNDTMLKFYKDKRKKISLLYRTRKGN